MLSRNPESAAQSVRPKSILHRAQSCPGTVGGIDLILHSSVRRVNQLACGTGVLPTHGPAAFRIRDARGTGSHYPNAISLWAEDRATVLEPAVLEHAPALTLCNLTGVEAFDHDARVLAACVGMGDLNHDGALLAGHQRNVVVAV